MAEFDYDLFVIGGGSGGVRAARVAAGLGKRVGIAEEFRYGGTCVIRGCVPKKLYVYASQQAEHFEDAVGYGFSVGPHSFDWPTLVEAKDAEIDRLEGLYRKGLDGNGADIFDSRAVLTGQHSIKLVSEDREVSAERILIAVGGRPNPHAALEGHEHCISSNEAFDLEEFPKKIIIAGGGYIAVEFAGIFAGLGADVTLLYRGREILSRFDHDMRVNLHEEMTRKGIRIITETVFSKIEKPENRRLRATLSDGRELEADQIMLALGRLPNTAELGLETAGVETGKRGEIIVDEYSRTNVPHILAVGDVTDRVQLTPVAIHEAMCLIETEFKDNPTSPDHDMIATAVFSQPEIGTVGLSEEAAAAKYANLSVFRARFRPMKYVLPKRDSYAVMKLIVDEQSDRVVGAHILGPEAGEMAQLLGIILKAGCTKAHFDATMALHPSAAEELVTMYQPTYRVVDGKKVDG
ncbi:MAG: glutathione-disulfide reductase [Pseudomonadota bacterium]